MSVIASKSRQDNGMPLSSARTPLIELRAATCTITTQHAKALTPPSERMSLRYPLESWRVGIATHDKRPARLRLWAISNPSSQLAITSGFCMSTPFKPCFNVRLPPPMLMTNSDRLWKIALVHPTINRATVNTKPFGNLFTRHQIATCLV